MPRDAIPDSPMTSIPSEDPCIDALWRDLDRESSVPFDPEHARALAAVLARRGGVGRRHPLDVRFAVPLLLRRYYVVLLAGRDRRQAVAAREAERRRAGTHALGGAAFAMLGSTVLVALALTGALALYGLKSLFGLDLFPGFHATDLFSPTFWRG